VMSPDLLRRFAEASDTGSEQGRVHPVAVVLALCAAAVVAGMASFTAIAGWATDVPSGLLAQLYGRYCEPASKATIWRVVTGRRCGGGGRGDRRLAGRPSRRTRRRGRRA
jgi:hypothetical protein